MKFSFNHFCVEDAKMTNEVIVTSCISVGELHIFRYELDGQDSKIFRITEFKNLIMKVEFSPAHMQLVNFKHEVIIFFINVLETGSTPTLNAISVVLHPIFFEMFEIVAQEDLVADTNIHAVQLYRNHKIVIIMKRKSFKQVLRSYRVCSYSEKLNDLTGDCDPCP